MYDKSSINPIVLITGAMCGFVLVVFSAILVATWVLWIFPDQYDDSVDRGRQEATMLWMQQLGKAATLYHIDHGRYVGDLGELSPNYLDWVPPTDAWGNAWEYRGGTRITLMSLGADGRRGPLPEQPWRNSEPYEADLVMENGAFVQAPGLY